MKELNSPLIEGFSLERNYHIMVKLNSREYTTTLGQVMKHFREQILGFTVPEMSRKIDIPATTIYNFENGNSTNANNIRYYFHLCKSQEQRKIFKQRINEFNNDILKVN